MTKKQLIVLWIGLAVIGAMCLVPPWASNSSSGSWHFRGYHFILTFGSETRYDHIYITRLAIQCGIVAALAFGVIMTMGRKRLPQAGDTGAKINWRRGFRRITLLVAIASGAVGGICAGAIPSTHHADAQRQQRHWEEWWWFWVPWVQPPTQEEVAEFEKWVQEMEADGTPIRLPHFDNDALWCREMEAQGRTTAHAPFYRYYGPNAAAPKLKDIHAELLARVKNFNHDYGGEDHFWLDLSRLEVVGMCALYGLVGAFAGFVGVWVVLWFGGLTVHRVGRRVARWVVLGFQDRAV